jgi:hypothetical protein
MQIDKSIPMPEIVYSAERYPAPVRQIGECFAGGTIVAVKRKRRCVQYTLRR